MFLNILILNKKNKKIVSKAIKKNGYALMYAHRSIKKDKKFIKKILKYYLGGIV